MNWKNVKNNLLLFFQEFSDNRIPKMAASLAYYTVFALPALLLIILWLNHLIYENKSIESTLFTGMADLIGKDSANLIQSAIKQARVNNTSYFAKTVGIVTLLLGATGIFGEIQDSINQIWHLKIVKTKGLGWMRIVFNRLLSFSIIAVLGFLLLVSLIINSLLDVLFQQIQILFPNLAVWLLYLINQVISFVLISGLFAVIFRVLPDAKISWKDVRTGALVSAVLFMIGKVLISYIVATSKIPAYYGAAASMLALLIWIYYSAIILFAGAVFTRIYVIKQKRIIQPNRYAKVIENKQIEKDLILDTDIQE